MRLLSNALVVFLALIALLAPGGPAAAQGPVILMSLDAEDGGPDNRNGPLSAYGTMLNSILDHVRSEEPGILVVGAGKAAEDDVTTFWGRMTRWTDREISLINGPDAISRVDFSEYALVVIASNDVETPRGGLTQEENDALADRQRDLSSFVNAGGGLWAFMQGGFSNPYAWIEAELPLVVETGHAFRFLTPTLHGVRIGLNEVFEVCCWHDEISGVPDTFQVLAVRTKNGAAIAVGGIATILGSSIAVPLDINPGVYPNKLDVRKSKDVRIAINGTPDFDVFEVDVATLHIAGVSPKKVRYKDVSTAWEPYLAKASILEGTAAKKDGETDLLLYFDREELFSTLDSLERFSQHRLELEGSVLDGRSIEGLDWVQLVGKKAEKKKDETKK